MKLVESNIPEGVNVRVAHLHIGNSDEEMRQGRPYRTVAFLEVGNAIVGWGDAACSRRDVPNRKRGRAIAVGRAMKDAGIRRVQ